MAYSALDTFTPATLLIVVIFYRVNIDHHHVDIDQAIVNLLYLFGILPVDINPTIVGL